MTESRTCLTISRSFVIAHLQQPPVSTRDRWTNSQTTYWWHYIKVVVAYEYCIVLIFLCLNFHDLLFLTILLKKFREYAVQTGDGVKCQKFSLKYFCDGIEFTKTAKYKRYTVSSIIAFFLHFYKYKTEATSFNQTIISSVRPNTDKLGTSSLL